jgi:hypothetical protein
MDTNILNPHPENVFGGSIYSSHNILNPLLTMDTNILNPHPENVFGGFDISQP